MTSSDVLDTCLAVQLSRAADILIADVDALLKALKTRAFEYRRTPTIGRSHGIHAEPTTFGLKLAGFYAEFARARARLVSAREEIATCAISGAVGTFANVAPEVEAHVAEKMGLKVEPVSTQVIPRDRHAMFFATLGVIASSLERLATEIRHLQRTEVGEAEEYLLRGAERLLGDAAQAQSGAVGESLRAWRAWCVPPSLPRWRTWRFGMNATSRTLPSSASSRPDATITLDFALVARGGADREAGRLSGADAGQSRSRRRARAQRARAAGAHAEGRLARGCVSPGAVERDARVARRRRA